MQIVTLDIGHNHGTDGEAHSPEQVERVVSRLLTLAGFDGHTITHGVGYWRGEREAQTSARVYLLGTGTNWREIDAIRKVAGEIRDGLEQQAVGFTVQEARVEFV